jgi:hypothetical protein
MVLLLTKRSTSCNQLFIFFQLIQCTEAKCKRWLLTAEGNQIADNGSHEAIVFNSIPSGGILLEDLMV